MVVKTKWPAAVVSRVGRGVLLLAQENQAVLAPRLAPGIIEGLAADLDVFEGKRASVPGAKTALRGATLQQDEAAERAKHFLLAARAALAQRHTSDSERVSFGSKLKVEVRKVGSVVSALQAFLEGSAKLPEVARRSGLLQTDLDHARDLLSGLVSADATQETQKEVRKQSTTERNATQVRIENAVDAIIAAARIAFLSKPEVAERFVKLVPSSPKKKKKAPTA